VTERVLLSELLSRLAHDLRAPLGLVSGALAELGGARTSGPDSAAPGGADEAQQRALRGLAARGVARIERLAERLSLAAALEGGRLTLDRAPCDAAAIARAGSERAALLENRRGVEVELLAPAPVPLSADAARLTFAIAELASNAWRHARSRVRISVGSEEGSVLIEVQDDGAGVPPATRKWLFSRLDPEAGRAAGNLGLALARDLARAHGGDVTLEESEPTRFVLRLPPGP